MDAQFHGAIEQLIVRRAEAGACFQRASAEPGLQHVMRIQRTISAGEVFRVPLRVTQLGTHIEWDFRVKPDGHDVRFACVAPGEDEDAISELHTSAQSHLEVRRMGPFLLCFDNSHSMFTSKEVHCTLRMREPQAQRAIALRRWLSEAAETIEKATALHARFLRRQECSALDAATKRHVAARLGGLDAQQVKRMDEQFQRTERMRSTGPHLAVERARSQAESDAEAGANESASGTELASATPATLQTRFEIEHRASNTCIAAIERSRRRRAELEQARQRIHSLVSDDERTAKATLLPAVQRMLQQLRKCLDNAHHIIHPPNS